jgi:dTDP-4-dehydrorhamnose reductase
MTQVSPAPDAPTRWLITGSYGQLGTDLQRVLGWAGETDVTAVDRDSLDLTDASAVSAFLADLRPDFVLNAAAYTAVDAAETDEATALLVNATAVGYLARSALDVGARLVHVSTDYVFAGDATSPYLEDDEPDPRSAYGRTKLAGEKALLSIDPSAYVLRTAWVYGQTGNNFVKTMLRLAGQHDTVSVVDDQRGSPTWSQDLARGMVALAQSGAAPGIYHCTNSQDTTWFGLTQAIFEKAGLDPARVLPTTTDKFPRPAPRPAYSVLSHAKWNDAGLPAMPAWADALQSALDAGGFLGESST